MKNKAILDTLMKLPISDKMFDKMFSIYTEQQYAADVMGYYGMPAKELKDVLHEELFVPGMTNEIAWQAMCFIILTYNEHPEWNIRRAIRNCILMSGIYFTNVTESKRQELESKSCS